MSANNTCYIIYKATNEITDQIYIGATTKRIEERKLDHIQKATTNKGGGFQEAIRTFGPDAFIWEQIDTASNANELAEKEKQYIVEFNSKEQGYNSDCGGGIKKMVYQYNLLDGCLMASYQSLANAAYWNNCSKQSISKACLGENTTCKGFYWSYTLTEPYIVEDNRKKEVVQLSLDEEQLNKYSSVSEASRITGISKTCISRCCRGEREQTGGFKFKYT